VTPPASTRSTRTLAGDGKPRRGREREVVDAAAKVFARKGYAAATIQDVADELGILKGSLYYYIKTKEDLLVHLLNEVHDEVDALLTGVREAEVQDPLERLALYVRTQTDYNLRNLVKISVYYNDIDQLGDERRQHVLRRRKVHEDFITDVILDAQRQGRVDGKRDARLLAYSVFATIIWPYRWYRPRGRIKVEDIVDTCVEFVLHGIAGGSGR
jgi:AcrR family transcriptional regulator